MSAGLDRSELRPERRTAAREQLVNVVSGRAKLPNPRRRLLVILAATTLAAAGTIGAIQLKPSGVITDTITTECRSTLDPDEEGNSIGFPTPVTNIGTSSEVWGTPSYPGPIEACSIMWRSGDLVLGRLPSGPLRNSSTVEEHPVPALTVCVAAGGYAVVVPSDNPGICHVLDLSDLATG